MDDVIEKIARISGRLTPQRIVLTKIIMNMVERHPTLNEIVEEARKVLPYIGVSTTYNTIKMLEEAGLISVIEVDGKMRIDRPHPHVNIVCRSSGRVVDANDDEVLRATRRMLEKLGYSSDGDLKLTVYADC